MAHLFTEYKVYTVEGTEWTKVKYMINGLYKTMNTIHKPTADLTASELAIISQFSEIHRQIHGADVTVVVLGRGYWRGSWGRLPRDDRR